MFNPCHHYHRKGYAAKPPSHDAPKNAHYRRCAMSGVGKGHNGADHDGKKHEYAAPAGAKPVGGLRHGKDQPGPAGHLYGNAHIGRHGVAGPARCHNPRQAGQYQHRRKRGQHHCPYVRERQVQHGPTPAKKSAQGRRQGHKPRQAPSGKPGIDERCYRAGQHPKQSVE